MKTNDITMSDVLEGLAFIKKLMVDNDSSAMIDDDSSAWSIGANYLVRTVTMTNTGMLVKITPNELVFEKAAWIADTGRFAESLVSCEFGEVEPFPSDRQVIVNRQAVIDAVTIHTLPDKVK